MAGLEEYVPLAPICRPGGATGMFFPFGGKTEEDMSDGLRTAIYGISLAYIFVAVSIVADRFMGAIETITSRVAVKRSAEGKRRTGKIWNDTVANLTLMALGSSAPEIMLSVVETLLHGNYSGDLGPGTIVGSAAFNLFVIIAACIVAIPSTEIRSIDAELVFFVTGVFSVVAYAWLVVIVELNTPDVVDIWEAVVTLLMMPVLVGVSYLCDIGWFQKLWNRGASGEDQKGGANLNGVSVQVDGGTGGSSGFDAEVAAMAKQGSKGEEQTKAWSPGVLGFERDWVEVSCGCEEKRSCALQVARNDGFSGKISCMYSTRLLTAIPGYDFEELSGELVFESGFSTADIELWILPRRPGQHKVDLQLVLDKVSGGGRFKPDSDGGEECNIITVTIKAEGGKRNPATMSLSIIDKVVSVNDFKRCLGGWADQIKAAVRCEDGDDEEGEESSESSILDKVVAAMLYPWNCIYSVLLPPPDVFGGYLCFWISLLHIGLLTIAIVDLAELFGCVAGIQDSITAFTFVALGTSMPDFFASKMAAQNDDNADASIINVTGSNSVNVFLGIGVPWTVASIFWKVNGPTDKWRQRYPDIAASYPDGAFVVRAGELSYTVGVFVVVAVIALVVIRLRRVFCGGELGGPFAAKISSAFLLLCLWIYCIVAIYWRSEQVPTISIEEQLGTAAWILAVALGIAACFVPVAYFIERTFMTSGREVVPAPDDSDKLTGVSPTAEVAPSKVGWSGTEGPAEVIS